MKISTGDARKQLSDIVNRAAYGKERIVLTRRGKALAAVVPVEDVEALEALEDRIDLEEARRAIARIENGEEEIVSWEQVKRELGLE